MNYSELLSLLAPEAIIALASLAVLGIDLVAFREASPVWRRLVAAVLTIAACLGAALWATTLMTPVDFMNGAVVLNQTTVIVKISLLVLTALTAWMAADYDFTPHVGEYFALLLLTTAGLMLLISSNDVLVIFLSLELSSVCLYVLTAFDQRTDQPTEAAMKYFLFGGIAAAFTLFGLSFLYGVSHSTNLSDIARAGLARSSTDGGLHMALDPLLAAGMVMTMAGFAFKIAAAPFHFWAPDVYESAPTPTAAMVAAVSKVGGFFVLARVTMVGFAGLEGSASLTSSIAGWTPMLACVAGVSIVWGNVAALAQTRIRRLLAYSAISHAGYVLIGILAPQGAGLPSVVYYSVTYALATLGAFTVISAVEQSGGTDHLASFAGFSRRAPLASVCLLVFVLSLAGIPPLAGFFAKFYVFAAALSRNGEPQPLLWLIMLALAASAVSLYYYLQILKQVYVREPAAGATRLRIPFSTMTVSVLLAALVVALGCFPNLLLRFLDPGK